MKLIEMLTSPVKASVIVMASFVGQATDVLTITNHLGRLDVAGNSQGVMNQSVDADSYKQDCVAFPVGVVAPMFWFDASDTNGWTVSASGEVLKLPSKVGTRYLTTTEESEHWASYGDGKARWGNALGPTYRSGDAHLGGRPYLDFGTLGSKHFMLFNPIGEEGSTSNLLENVGSIVAVWDSTEGGGTFFGGLRGMNEWIWCRGADPSLPNGSGIRRRTYLSPLSCWNSMDELYGAYLRKDGTVSHSAYAGFNGGWEIISLLPTAATMPATGIGFEDLRITAYSGGFRVAEMLVFDRVLTHAESFQVETWLKAKWFGRTDAGVNGTSYMTHLRPWEASQSQYGVPMTVNVKAGESLAIARLEGGYGRDGVNPASGEETVLIKTGVGELKLGNARNFSAPVRLAGGKLTFDAQKAVPTELPDRMYLHFDASAPDVFETTTVAGVRYVDFWKSLLQPELGGVRPIEGAAATSASDRPWILENELGEGLHVVDFGPVQSSTTPTRYLKFQCNEDPQGATPVRTDVTFGGANTFIAVVGAQNGGGDVIGASGGCYMVRNAATSDYSYPFIGEGGTVGGVSTREIIRVMVDGVVSSPAEGYPTPNYHVIAMRGPASPNAGWIGGYYQHAGGLRLAELAIYRRTLTDDEMRDASAYLLKKWLKKDAPGYGSGAQSATPDLQKLEVAGDVEIDVEDGTTVIGKITASNAKIVKSGAGTLAVNATEFVNTEFKVTGGAIKPVAVSDVATDCELAKGASFHLDATDASTFDLQTEGDDTRVVRWHDVDGNDNVALSRSFAKSPSVTTAPAADGLKEDLPVMDFGTFTLSAGTGRDLYFAHPVESARSVFIVWATQHNDSRGIYLGGSKSFLGGGNNVHYGYLRPSTSETADPILFDNGSYQHIIDGTFYTNGVAIKPTKVAPVTGQFMLLESHPKGAAHVSSMGVSETHAGSRNGGVRIGELVVYERELSEREKIATRNYLMQKWFGTKSDAKMPDPPQVETMNIPGITVDGSLKMDVDSGVEARELKGEGAFEKGGDGVLAIEDMSSYAGTVDVEAGTLRITGKRPTSAGALVTDGLAFQLDASRDLTIVTNANGTLSVTEWRSTLGDDWRALPLIPGKNPVLEGADGLRSRPVVNMPLNKNTAMFFTNDGVSTNVFDGIATVFWMVGSQEGGSHLLGGGTNYESSAQGFHMNFLRERVGHSEGYCKTGDRLLCKDSYWCNPANVRRADWRKNGESIDPGDTGLSGQWDLLSMTVTDKDHPFTNAEGLAFDGRGAFEGTYLSWLGGQKLAELIFYNRALTDEERLDVENYLRSKWGFQGTQASSSNAVMVTVAEGATLDLGGNAQYLAGVSGTGTITNGKLTLGTLVADPLAESVTVLDATLAFDETQVIEVRNAAAIAAGGLVKICDCAAVENLPAKRDLVFTGDTSWCASYRAKLVFEDGSLYVKFDPRGMLMIVR